MSELWEKVRLADVVETQIGGTPSRFIPSFWAEKPAGHPWIAISDLKSKFIFDTQEYITDLGAQCSNVKLIPTGSTVMSFKLSVGRTGITTRPMYCNEAIAIFLPRSDSVDSTWLYHVLPTATKTVVTDTAVKGVTLNKAKMAEMILNLPPPNEQVKIAQIIDTLDTAIQKTEAIVEKLKQVKQGLLHDLLTRGIDANGELRPSHEQAPRLYKESPLGRIPKEWEIKYGNEVCDEIVVGIVIKPTQYYREHGIPVFRSANVRENRLSLENLVYMDFRDHRALNKSAVKYGDVLTVRTGYPGTSCVVNDSVGEANCVDIIISRPSYSLFSEYWSAWINSDFGKKQVLAVQGGLAQQHFNVGDLAKLMVALPSLDEQKSISRRLSALHDKIVYEDSSRQGLMSIKSGLMDDLLTGRVRVTPLLKKEDTDD